ncbi:ACS family glucarate transporter-like MFS transporter [Arthrobacter sp. 1088]|uniref:MFS transporter n=1 Tax=Arthrobacter sp. 1088 TaxID=2817768 RepID=UPI00285428FB|nr:MFS transporter [Arthrobacter sp. 1088]MDR6687749.1 ACS family glucarate transporter-like MFS transporter [Arthrobacter sp. 1088]
MTHHPESGTVVEQTRTARESGPSQTKKPHRTRVRWTIVFLVFLGMLISYIDRANLAVSLPYLKEDLGIAAGLSGLILGAFYWTYAACQMPLGRLVDRVGPRFLFAGAVVWWSICTALTSAVKGFGGLFGLRLLLGVGEAAAFPSGIKTVGTWFPLSERGRASGIVASGARAGSLLALPVVTALIAFVGWRGSFIITGAIGVVWAVVWVLYYRSPEKHSKVSPAELEFITEGRSTADDKREPIRWTKLIKNRNVTSVALGFWCVTFVEYFFITWFPTYLVQDRGFNLLQLGVLGMIPAITALIGQYLGGYTTDALLRRGWSVTRSRKTCIIVGSLLSSVIAFAAIAESAAVALALLSISTASIMFAVASIYCLPGDLSPRKEGVQSQEGSIAGIINGISNTAGIASPAIIGFILGATGSFVYGLFLAGAIAVLGVIFFAFGLKKIEPMTID